MARRAPTEDKQARAAREAAEHGGLVSLAGGPEVGWFWRDDWERQRTTRRFAGYVETSQLVENYPIKDPNGVDLRWYGPGTVWRFDPAMVPPDPPVVAADPIPPTYCACGERLLIIGRDTRERCRMGIPPGACLVWRPFGEASEVKSERTAEPPADPVLGSGESIELRPQSAPVTQPQELTPQPDPAEVAAFVWQHIAHLYDR